MPHLNEFLHLDRWILSSYTFTDFPLPYLYTGRVLVSGLLYAVIFLIFEQLPRYY